MKALVLGGTRFIGLHLVQILHSQGHQVTTLNRGETRAKLPEGVTRLYADRTDPSQVKAALKGASFDAVFDIFGRTPATLQPVVEALEGRVGHFVFCSTGAVYGSVDTPINIAPIPEDFPVDRSPNAERYTTDKVLCEDLLMEAFTRRAFPATILRPFYVYGPDNPNKSGEASFFARLTQRRRIIIPGDGYTLFHLVHVDDLAAAFASVPGRSHVLGQAYNIGGPEGITANGYVQNIGEVMGVASEVVHVEPTEYEALTKTLGPPGGPRVFPYPWRISRVYSIAKANHDLDWSPRYDVRAGLAMTYRWWVDQRLDRELWDFSVEDRLLARVNSDD